MTITAAVDGSSLGNPGPGGWAWVVNDEVWAAGGFRSATNNIGELTALLRLLEDTAKAGFADEPLVVLADSQYVINSVTKWMAGWKRRGWKKADGKPVANKGIMVDLDRALAGRDVTLKWVKGHAGHDLNEDADMRAQAAAQAFRDGRPPQEGPGFVDMFASKTAIAKAREQRADRYERRAEPKVQAAQVSSDVQKPLEPIVAVSAQEALARWDEVLASAQVDPVTITQRDAPSLLLLDADIAWRALNLLDSFGEQDQGSLF